MKEEMTAYSTDLDYLQDELDWIEARCRRIGANLEVQRLEGTDDLEYEAAPRRTRHTEDLTPRQARERRRVAGALEARLLEKIAVRRQMTLAEGRTLAMDRLVERCGLDLFERQVLLLAAAPCFSQRYEDVFGLMEKDQFGTVMTVELAFRFAEFDVVDRIDRRRCFMPDGPLVLGDLAKVNMGPRYSSPKDLLSAEVEITARTFGYIVGREELCGELMEFSSVEEPLVTLERVVLPEEDKQRILAVVERHDEYLSCRKAWGFDDLIRYGRGAVMLFHGKPGTGKTMTAHGVAKHLGKRVLNVDIPTFVDHHDAGRFLPSLFREARLQNAVLFFDECEVLFASRTHGNQLMTLLLSEIERFDGIAILATNLPQVLDEALDRRVLVKVRFPEPDARSRLRIWRAHLPITAPLADDLDLQSLAERYEMSGGYIKNAVLTAVAAAVHAGGEDGEICQEMLDKAAQSQVWRPVDGDSRVVHPTIRLADVVVPEATGKVLHEVVSAVRHLRTVLERWGLGAVTSYGRGLSALMYGAPGTGKTLSAHAIAGELNRPLLIVSTSTILSKWVGEAERRLESVFHEARSEGAVLLLDEADSLLRARGEGQASRHDDSLVNALLQHLEQHEDLVLLATNRLGALDDALARRMTWRLRFPQPGSAERAAIWRRHLPPAAPLADDLDLAWLADRYSLSGGHIQRAAMRAALRAAVSAGVITQRMLVEAAEEQLEVTDKGKRITGFAPPVARA